MATQTQIKIRYGLILQAVLARALTGAGYTYAETPAYDPESEVPDFLIPDAENPEFVMEVHQTEARNHFQMKTLRSVTAVAEAKAFFGPDVVSVNVLFGDPDAEVPEANLRAMCGIFDMNLLLQRDATEDEVTVLRQLEAEALELAGQVAISTNSAASQLVGAHPEGVTAMGRLLNETLSNGVIKEELRPMWEAEESRRAALGEPPEAGESTFYKKNMIRSLFFTDADFTAMAIAASPDDWPENARQQAVLTGIAEIEEGIDGDYLIVDPEFLAFSTHADTPRLRQMCSDVLAKNEAMHWFFEDIRDGERRLRMCEMFLESLAGGAELFAADFRVCFETGSFSGIGHARCWLADLAPLCVGKSHNYFNGAMKGHSDYTAKLGNPFNNITIRSPRLGRDEEVLTMFQDVAIQVFQDELAEADEGTGADLAAEQLSELLLKLRMVGGMRLQFLEPLQLLTGEMAKSCGLTVQDSKLTTILSDFGGVADVGAFDFRVISSAETGQSVLYNAIAAEGNPRDKAKEWGARMLANLYRLREEVIESNEESVGVFAIDGIWEQSDITRLYRCGWDYVVRMGELEETLRSIFELPAVGSAAPTPLPGLPDEDDDLPMAAEDE